MDVPPQRRDAVPQDRPRKAPSMNRAVHRVGGILACLVMLWLGITGITMQIIDLHAIVTHQPVTTPTGLSIAEGMYGPGDFAVIQVADFTAPALPAGFDIKQGIQTVLQAAHTPQNRDGAAAPAAAGGGADVHAGPAGRGPRAQGGRAGADAGNHGGRDVGGPRPQLEPGAQGGPGGDGPRPHRGPPADGFGAPGGDGPRPHRVPPADGTTAQAGPGGPGGDSPRPHRAPGADTGGAHAATAAGATSAAATPAAAGTDVPAGPGGGGSRGRGGPGGPGGGGQTGPMAWVELRMLNGAPVGQVMMGTKLVAFNALTGAPTTPVPAELLPQGGRLPPSLRQKLKTWHRFWNRQDTPGVYFEFLVGLILWFLIITGLVIYFQLLGKRFRSGRKDILWVSGGWWRGLHRVVSVVSAVFLLCIAFSGTWIGFESSAGPLRRAILSPAPAGGAGQPGAQGQRGGGRRRNPIDFIIPLRDQEVQEMTETTLDSMKRLHPSTPIKVIRLRTYGQTKQAVFVTGGDETGQYVFNADSGEPASLTENGYLASNFPFGVQVHENIKHFHSGAMFGVSGRVMNLFAGSSLTFLAISGIVMYFDMWLKRRRAKMTSPVWR